jgi:hypothetical protein
VRLKEKAQNIRGMLHTLGVQEVRYLHSKADMIEALEGLQAKIDAVRKEIEDFNE